MNLHCNTNQVPITDGRYGNDPSRIDFSDFIAWNESSRIVFMHVGALTGERQVTLYFYHEPASGIGLPEFNLSASTHAAMSGDPLTYTILGNQDLTVDDAQVRNVTLALTEPITEPVDRFHIEFFLTNSTRQFAVSEVQLCNDSGKLHADMLANAILIAFLTPQ